MKLNKKIKKMKLLPLDDPAVSSKYSFPESVYQNYQYVKLSDPLMLYSLDYLEGNKYKDTKIGCERMTDSNHLGLKDLFVFRIYMIMNGGK